MTETAHFGDQRAAEERQLADLLAELRSIVDAADLGILDPVAGRRWSVTGHQVLSHARQRSRDKKAVPERAGRAAPGMGDPVGSGVAHLEDRDPDLEAWRALHFHLKAMRDAGLGAIRALAAATPANAHPHQNESGCRVCGDPRIYRGKPEDASERCEWCYRHWLEYSVDMPKRIIQWRKQGKVITPAMIRAELGELAGMN